MVIVLALAWAYVRYGSTSQATWLLYGIKPVIIAIVGQALWGLAKVAVRGPLLVAIGVAVLALYLLGFNEIGLLFGFGSLVMLVQNARRMWTGQVRAGVVVPLLAAPLGVLAQAAVTPAPFSPLTLFLTFLKIGAVIYGSGYVLLAFLRSDFVHRLGWLTDQQLLDAVAIGQLMPGPVFTTATFVGYLLGGLPGGILATVAIFLPGFVFVALTNPIIPKIRRSPWAAAFLDGVNVAALGLMAAVTWELGRAAIVDWLTVILALVAAVLLVQFRVNSAWLVAAGGLIGAVYRALGG